MPIRRPSEHPRLLGAWPPLGVSLYLDRVA
jgi:hypothetical protein